MGTQIGKLIVDSRHVIRLEDLRGHIIGIDAFNMIYAFLARIRNQSTGGRYFTDSKGNITSHLIGIFNRLTNLLNHDIKPVFIFDGAPPTFKETELDTRRKKKEEALIKQEEAISRGDLEEAMKYAQATSRITQNVVDTAKKLLNYFGVPTVQAAAEAEAQGAFMVKRGEIQGMASQDYDSFLFGAECVIRNLVVTHRRRFSHQSQTRELPPQKILLSDLLTELRLKNRDQLIMLGLLVGTDYNPAGIKGIGPKTGLKIVHKYSTPKSLLDYLESKYHLDEVFPFPPLTLFDYFSSPEVNEDIRFSFKKPQPSKIERLLIDEHDFSLDRIERNLKILEKLSSQETLDKFFS